MANEMAKGSLTTTLEIEQINLQGFGILAGYFIGITDKNGVDLVLTAGPN